ncbi:YeeE/YedE family protein [bacterium]|nr:YeeE/YedE family protein [bacterium]
MAAAGITGLWVLTAIPVGFLFGFFLQKGALCGSSAFSEVIIDKDAQKLWGLWVVIVTGMGGFALLDLAGLVTLNPKPFTWMSMIVGGAVFGTGMVLAGGCVSGSLFKAGAGHINSIIALPAIALGVAAVEAGPLAGLNRWMQQFVLTAPGGKPVTLGTLTGLPFWVLAVIVLTLTVTAVLLHRRTGAGSDEKGAAAAGRLMRAVTARRWKPWQAGIAIGLLGMLAYLSSASSGRTYPLGVTHGVYHVQLLITDKPLQHVYEKPAAVAPLSESPVPAPPKKKVSWWLILEVISLVGGSWVAARLSGEAKLYNKPPAQLLIALPGGFLVGIGAAFAKGCVVGNIMSGWALMSIGTVVFGITALLANWITTYVYLMGGRLSEITQVIKR